MFIYGASGHGRVIKDIADELALIIDNFIDDDRSLTIIDNIPVLHELNANQKKGILGIGNNFIRKKIAQKFDNKSYLTLIHPKTNISKNCKIGFGSVVMPGVTVNAGVTIGEHSIINTNSSVDHDCVVGDFVHISPNVALSGNVHVGEGTHIGIGACVIPGIKIGKWAVIGAGSVIIKDVPDFAVVVGNPGRIVKINES